MSVRFLSGVNVDQNTLFVDDANNRVGIGTASPNATLSLYAAGTAYINFRNSTNISSTYGFVVEATGNNSELWNYANGYLRFGTNNAERLRITAAGNVGIGTTSPDNVLDLGAASQGRALTWDNYSNVFGAYSSGNLVLSQNFYGDTATDTYKTSLTASYGAAGILISGTAAGLNGVMRFYVDNAAAKTAGAAFTPTERMQISGNGAIKFSTYGSGSFTGTVAYNLAVDSSGNIIETAGGVVDGSGTANYVSKWSDANTLTNSVIYDNGTSVGVGTTTPNPFSWATKTITVVSSASNSYAALEAYGNGTGAGALLLGNTSILRASIVAEDGSNLLFATNAGNTGSSQSERMRITSAGNVGIGTTAPIAKLHVDGSSYFNGNMGINGEGSGVTVDTGYGNNGRVGFMKYGGLEGMLVAGSSTLLRLGHRTDSTVVAGGTPTIREDLVITSAGNVGIGTTSPSEKLEVSGSAAGDFAALSLTNTNQSGTADASTISFKLGRTADSFLFTIPAIKFVKEQQWTGTPSTIDGALTFSTIVDESVGERMRITSAGNVGIGTTTPGAKLEVVAGNTTSISVRSGNSGQYSILSVGRTSSDIIMASAASSGQFWTGSVAGDGWVGSTNGTLSLGNDTTGVANLTIKSGNVGIGTTAPSYKLQIAEDTYARIALHQTTTGAIWNWGNDGSNMYAYYTNTGVRALDITNTGNVGIGTTSPSTKLDVIGVGAFGTMTSSRGAYSNGLSLQNNTGEATSLFLWQSGVASAHIGSPANSTSLHIVNSYNTGLITDPNSIVLTNTGNVGIGTDAPTQKLHVSGSARVTGAYYDSNNSAGSSGQVLTSTGTGTDWKSLAEITGVDGTGTANYIAKWSDTDTITNSQIRDDGTTVGVGTAPAAAKLTVDGALTAAGQTSYGKSYASLDTTGVAVAGLSSSTNGQSALFTFTCYGGDNHYQRVVYSCKNDSGSWYTSKVVDEGTNGLDVTASANGATITFTYKARSANQGYSPRILIDHLGSALNTSYL